LHVVETAQDHIFHLLFISQYTYSYLAPAIFQNSSCFTICSFSVGIKCSHTLKRCITIFTSVWHVHGSHGINAERVQNYLNKCCWSLFIGQTIDVSLSTLYHSGLYISISYILESNGKDLCIHVHFPICQRSRN